MPKSYKASFIFRIFAYTNHRQITLMLQYTKKHLITTLAIVLITTSAIIVMFASCAKVLAPTGGTKDSIAPVLVRSTPALKSINFKDKEIVITFNEFIQPLKDANNQVIISPPPEKMPEMKLKGRSIVIKFVEDLKPNSTYNIFFGDAILDLNEGNIKKNFYFTFSTGDKIDSLELRGRVNNAETGLPEKDVFIELYTGTQDSLPMKERPYYVGKSNISGDFTVKYLADKSYKLFALKDANSNLKYDLPTEAIAFASNPVTPEAPLPDSIDSLKRINTGNYHQLALFLELDSIQRIEKKTLSERQKITLQFRYPVKNLSIQPLNFKAENWNFNEWNTGRDTLNFWFTKELQDTLQMGIKADNMKLDTLQFILKAEKPVANKKDQKKEPVKKKLQIKPTSLQGTIQPYNQPLIFESLTPVNETKLTDLRLIQDKDTTLVNAVWADTLSHRRFKIDKKWKEKSSYSLLIPSERLTDIFGAVNDSVIIQFTTWEERDYGSLALDAKISTTTGQWIFQLLNEKDALLREIKTNKSDIIKFDLLAPAKYLVKIIYDENGNGVWDTGNYMKHRQPEKVIRFNKELEVRAFWDLKESIELKPD